MPSFQKQALPYSDSKLLSPLVLDYLDGKLSWLTGYEKDSAFDSVIAKRNEKGFRHREKLVEVLKEQNRELSPLQNKNLESLLADTTFTVTTGHQLNLFTGPLYFIYKIITTINLAEELNNRYWAYHFVPVYWMASEDHDIKEINHVNLYGKNLEWNTQQEGAAGRLSCKGIHAVIDEAEKLLGVSENSKRVIELLRMSYSEKHSLSEATRIVVNELFGKYGLLILDADDAQLKKEFLQVMKDDLQNHSAFKLVNETVEQLKEKKYIIQVQPREINLFFLNDNSRDRIIEKDRKYYALNKDGITSPPLSEKDLNELSLSPNVVLRPLYQEMILPNVAYVGGPAEIAYWLEYKSTFDHYKVSYPVLVLRNMAAIVDANSFSKMQKLGFPVTDFFQSADELAKKYVIQNDHHFSIKEEEKQITEAYEALKKKISQLDITLAATVEAEKQKNLNSLKALEEKAIRAGKKKHESAVQQIHKLKDKLFPTGVLHERIDNFLPYYVKYGDGFIDILKENFVSGKEEFIILIEDTAT